MGPVGIVIGLAIAASLGLAKLFGGGWEKSVAKKLVKSYEENEVLDKYSSSISGYWDDTDKAFNAAAKKLDEEWDNYVSNLEALVDDYDVDNINNNITTLKNVQSFFENIPLS